MDEHVRRFRGVGVLCSEELTTRVGYTQRRRHLRLVPDPEVADTIAPAPDEESAAPNGLGSVTRLPTYIPAEGEHDGDEGEDRGAGATEVGQGTRPRTDGELEEQEDEEDFPRQAAAALRVPRP
jgi:hypothetical protein